MNFANRFQVALKGASSPDAKTTGNVAYAFDGRWKVRSALATIDMGANEPSTGDPMPTIKRGEAAIVLVSLEFSSNNAQVAMSDRVKLEDLVVTDGSESATMPVAPAFPAVPDGSVPIGYIFIGNVGSGSTLGDFVPGTTALDRDGLAVEYGDLAGVLPGRPPVTDVPAIAT